jgi:hypothetical protein
MRLVILTSGFDRGGKARLRTPNQLRSAAAPLLGLFMGLFVALFAETADGQELDKPSTMIAGRILDDERRPMVGADVWILLRRFEMPGSTPHATPVELNSPDKPERRELRLRPVGRIEGRIEADRPEWTRRVKVYLSTTDAPGFEGGLAEVTTGDDGHFVVPAIAEGKLELYLDPSRPVRPRPIGDVEIRANRTTKFVISLEKVVHSPARQIPTATAGVQ